MIAWLGLVASCAAESRRAVTPEKPAAGTTYAGAKSALIVGKLDNRSSYLCGMFADGVDRLGGQTKAILVGHLQETGGFEVLDRNNLDELAREARIKGEVLALAGADFALTGDVVEGSATVDVVAALVSQVPTSTKDQAHGVSRNANEQLFFAKRRELPHGP